MRTLTMFNSVTLNGYFSAAGGDLSWAHQSPHDDEWNAFVSGNAKGGGELLFGRVTYDMMNSYWPTPMAAQQNPGVAERMNAMPKTVFSRTLKKATWNNTTVLNGDLATEVRKLKKAPGDHITILGSGSIVAQLAPEGLIDEYQIVVCPVALGEGRTLFGGMERALHLKQTGARAFTNGNVVLSYAPA